MQILDKDYYKIILQYINKNFKKDEIIIIENLEKRKLDNFYKYSQLFIFTSYCEVFGLTSLEAMSNGAPVLISNRSALPEVNKDAALYFDPDNIKDTDDINNTVSLCMCNYFDSILYSCIRQNDNVNMYQYLLSKHTCYTYKQL